MTSVHHHTIETTVHARPAIVAGAIAAVVNRLVDLVRAWKNRREIYRLGEMSDAQLADIGLVRSDLHVAWQTPFGVDPTAHLGSISAGRMRAAEQAARRIH